MLGGREVSLKPSNRKKRDSGYDVKTHDIIPSGVQDIDFGIDYVERSKGNLSYYLNITFLEDAS